MTTFKKFTLEDYRQAVKKAKEEGHVVVGYLWDGIEFNDMIIRHVEEVRF